MKKLIAVLCVLLFSSSVSAHKLNVFAFVEGGEVHVEAYFSDGILAKNAKLTVTNTHGDLIYEGRTNELGQHQFNASGQADLRIKINAGLGHIASYQLGTVAVADTASDAPEINSSDLSSSSIAIEDIQKAVAEAIKPLAREISELKNKNQMSDIVGGIGFVLGILGLFAYLKYRKDAKNS